MSTTTLHEPAPELGATDATKRTRGRRTLVLLALVCLAPVILSYSLFYLWPPQGRVNYGALVTPAPLPAAVLAGVDGQPDFSRDEFEGRWTLLYAGPGACDASCEAALYAMRQSRRAQASEMERVGRVWLVTDGETPPPALLAAHEGLRVARAAPAWLAQLPGMQEGAHVYLVDPLGNVMMRFPEAIDPKGVIRDLRRLLKYSALGRG